MIKAFWLARSSRERMLIGVSLLLLVLGGGVLPLMDKHEELARRTTAWAADAARADSLVKAIQDARVTKKSNLSSLGPTLQANLDASLQAANLKESVKKIELKDPRHVQVSFEAAEFALLVEWITRVHQEMQVQVIEADLSATETAGVVNGTVLLEAPGV